MYLAIIIAAVLLYIWDWSMSCHPHTPSSGRKNDSVFDEHIEEAHFFRGGGDDF